MSLKALFQSAVDELRKREIPFAVAGGFAADLYRREPRLTMDVDFVVWLDKNAVDTAASVIESLGLKVGVVRTADLAGGPLFAIKKKRTQPCMVVGRKDGEPSGEGVDLLLPEIPWSHNAVIRAQENPVDFGFGPVPALTVEDVVIAKLYSLHVANLRAKDLDDLQSIFAADPKLNMAYLAGQMSRLHMSIPDPVKPFLPTALLEMARDVERSRKEKGE